MSVAWNGATPASFQDPGVDYELGVRYLVSADISITQVRVYGPATSANLANRRAYIRTTADVILATIVLPNTLAAGWQTYDLAAPLAIDGGTTVWVTYGTLTDYSAVTAPGYPVASADGAVTANLGGFSDTVGNLPSTTLNTFYGIDFVYDVVPSTAPVVGLSVVHTGGLAVSAQLTIEDDHPDAVTYLLEWGDGATAAVSSLGPHVHTYAAPGLYAVLVTATDGDGFTDAAAAPVLMFAAGGRLTRRADFAAGLSTVPGVTGHAYRPATPRAGDAWPLMGALERADGSAFAVTWTVRVQLPADERAASVWADGHTDAIYDAVQPVAYVERIEVRSLPGDASGASSVLEFTCRSE